MRGTMKMVLAIALSLLLVGCQSPAPQETTGGPATFPPVTYENDIGIAPDDLFPFSYSEDIIALLGPLDCNPGYLYVYRYSTKEVTQITDFPILDLTETQECIFYVTEDYRIVRTNYTGDYHEVIYTAGHGAIPKIEYGYGKLTFPDGDHVMVMDLNAGTCKDVFQLEKLEMVQHCAVGTNLFIRADGDFLGLDYSTGKTCTFPSYQAGYDFMSQGIWPEEEAPETTVPETTAGLLMDESNVEGFPRDTQPWPQGGKGITFLTEQDLTQLTYAFSDTKNWLPGANVPRNWYARALVTPYEKPEQMQLLDFFYSGILPYWDPESKVTDEEREHLIEVEDYPEYMHPHRLPRKEMDKVLKEYFGISLDDMDWTIQKLDYWEKTDCYYYAANDALIMEFLEFEKGYMTEDGILRLYYYHEFYQWPFIVTLQAKEQDYGYWVLSNLPVEQPQ